MLHECPLNDKEFEYRCSNCICERRDPIHTDHQLLHPATVGELRNFLEVFDDDCELMAMNWGAFRYVLDDNGNGKVQYT